MISKIETKILVEPPNLDDTFMANFKRSQVKREFSEILSPCTVYFLKRRVILVIGIGRRLLLV